MDFVSYHLKSQLLLLFFSFTEGIRLKQTFAPSHPSFSPNEIYSSPCFIPEQYRTCALRSLDKSKSWSGIKTLAAARSDKYVILKPTPKGSFAHARRICEACDLEVGEVWDEDDLAQILQLLGVNNGSFWIGAFLNEKQSRRLRWTYQDGKTFVGFKEAINGTVQNGTRACLTLGKVGKYSSWSVVPCNSPQQSIICQYKKKYDCYANPGGNERDLLTHFKDGLYFSSKGQSWSLGAHACSTHSSGPLSLLLLKPGGDYGVLASHISKHLSSRSHDPAKTRLWTGFKYDGGGGVGGGVAWYLGEGEGGWDGEGLSIPNWESSLPWGTKPNTSASSCIYLTTAKNEIKLHAGDCELELLFVCKASIPDGPEISYCEKDVLVQRKASNCKWNWVFDKKPPCICFKGVHGLTSHTTCNSRLLIGPRCINFPSDKGTILHWKPIPDVDPTTPFLLLQNRNRRGNKFIQWISIKADSKRQIFGDANVYFSSTMKVIPLDKGKYCFYGGGDAVPEDPATEEEQTSSSGSFNEIKLRNESCWIIFAKDKESCGGGADKKGREEEESKLQIIKHRQPKDSCTLKCSIKSSESQDGGERGSTNNNSTTLLKKKLDFEEQTNLNMELLKHSIDSMFPSLNSRNVSGDWNKRLQLLQKLFEISKIICGCMVPSGFLDNVYDLFKIAYASSGGLERGEDFKGVELDKIGGMLRGCEEQSLEKAVVCERNECNGRGIKIAGLTSDFSIKTVPVDDSGYAATGHHHLLETVWAVIEVWNVACIKEFKESYLLYHSLEQVLERLFEGELKKLWHSPALPLNYYTRLLGPNEEIHMENLKVCVGSLHEAHPKVMRLTRPKTPPSDVLGKQIRNRKRNEEFLNEQLSKTIFCSKDQFCLD